MSCTTCGKPAADNICIECFRLDQDAYGKLVDHAFDLFTDVHELLAGGLPDPPQPEVLARSDGTPLFYLSKVNVLFGEAESLKTWIGLAAVAEQLTVGNKAAVIDLDHNGPAETVGRLAALGVPKETLADDQLFRLAEPDDRGELLDVVGYLVNWSPKVALVDSVGEVIPMLGLNSNSPDDYTLANRKVLMPMTTSGTAVIGIDHLPKNQDTARQGASGTVAKRRAANGSYLRVTLLDPAAPGRTGRAKITINKDRPGGLRSHCPPNGKGEQHVGTFQLDARRSEIRWSVIAPPMLEAFETNEDRLVRQIRELRLPPSTGRPTIKAELAKQGITAGTNALSAALSRWKSEELSEPTADSDGQDSQQTTIDAGQDACPAVRSSSGQPPDTTTDDAVRSIHTPMGWTADRSGPEEDPFPQPDAFDEGDAA